MATSPSADRRARRRAEASGKSTPVAGPTLAERFWDNVRFYAVAITVLLLVRAFLFAPYRIPTPSMEKSLLVGDFLIVSKWHYGVRTPNTIGVPFVNDWYLKGVELPQWRWGGFSQIYHNDVIVFNYPPSHETDPVYGSPPDTPIERRLPYIKRVIGMPGDTLRLLDKVVYLNGTVQPMKGTMEQHWRARLTEGGRLGVEEMRQMDVEPLDPRLVSILYGNQLLPTDRPFNGSVEDAERLRQLPVVASVEPLAMSDSLISPDIFPRGSQTNRDTFGPVVVPGAGRTVTITPENWPMLREVIIRYENRNARLRADGTFELDGQPAQTFTFSQDYYFVMGDNRDNSQDGRYWGFVPYDHVIGKAVLVFMSIDTDRFFLPRLSRFFRPIT